MPTKLMVHALTNAAMAVPTGTGLGSDGIYPRAICRLSEDTLEWLAAVIYHCEVTGVWPGAVDIVIIALIPKSDGGLRPIGLMPFIVRIWSRARKVVATEWGKHNNHPFFYAGKGMGADVAAWKQAARAELATTATFRIGYAQTPLGLV